MSSFLDYLLVISVMIALLIVRFGLPALCTWAICCISRRLSHQA